MSGPVVGRRIVFTGFGALGVAAALAGCGGGGDGGSAGSAASVASGTELASTADVPVGGGLILSDQQIVITQPTAGTFVAFSSICTHNQLPVTSVESGTILCARHGSEYSAETGEVENGPASTALSKVEITVSGDKILSA